MGRKKKVLTETEIEERKKRWWGPERNARRRARYHQDPQYREQAIQQVRSAYRKSREAQGLDVREDDCRENLSKLSQLGQIREVRIDADRLARMLTFTLEELADVFGRNTQVLYRWIMVGMFPPPLYTARNQRNRWQAVYSEAEVRAVVAVLGKHQETSQYYRTFHTETRDAIFKAVEGVRLALARKLGVAA